MVDLTFKKILVNGVEGYPTSPILNSSNFQLHYHMVRDKTDFNYFENLVEVIDKLPNKLAILLSGKDSYLIALAAKMLKKDVKCYNLKFNDNHQTLIETLANSLNFDLVTFELSQTDYIDIALYNSKISFVTKPTYLIVPYLFSKIEMDRFVLIGEGDPEKSFKSFFEFRKNIKNGDLVVSLAEFSYQTMLLHYNRNGIGSVFSSSPKLINSGLNLVELDSSGSSIKQYIKRFLPDQFTYLKTDNWDNNTAVNKLIRRKIYESTKMIYTASACVRFIT